MPGSPYLFQSGAAASFDSLAPTTTKGDVIVHNGSVNVRQAVGSNGQIITADSAQTTGIKWATPGNRAVRSVTSTDTVLTTDDVNLLSSTSFTSTLFAGSGNTGKPVTFIHDGTSLTGIYTIARAGSDPIGPNSVASLKLYMKGEALTLMWNGTYWEILSWTFPSVPVNYTPTFQGGTGGGGNVNVSYYATRISQCHLLTQGSHTLGTQAGTEMRVGLLGGLTSSANYLASGTMLGFAGTDSNTANNTCVIIKPSVAYVNFSVGSSSRPTTTAETDTNTFGSGKICTFSVIVAITEFGG